MNKLQVFQNKLAEELKLVPGVCINCREPFSEKNVFTEDGWKETKISNMCEKCFDGLFDKDDEG